MKRVAAMLSAVAGLLCIILLMPGSANAAGGVKINETNFPDEAFRQYVVDSFDKNKDGSLSDSERNNAEAVDVPKLSISSLKGIEYFAYLRSLDCSGNQLTNLDVSSNTRLASLNCSSNRIKALTVGENNKLSGINCSNNKLTGLDLSSVPNLAYLLCDHNQIKRLDVNKNRELCTLDCSHNNITYLNFYNWKLNYVYIEKNPITYIDLSHANVSSIMLNYPDYVFEKSEEFPPANVFNEIGCFQKGYDSDWSNRFLSFDSDDTVVLWPFPDSNDESTHGVVLEAERTDSGIKLSWGGCQIGPTFEIFRKKNDGDYSRLASVSANKVWNGKLYTYTDKTAVSTGKYTYLVRATNGYIYSESQTASAYVNPFTDVSETASYISSVMWAVQYGIVSGTTSTTFSPKAACTRYQFAVMLYRLAGKPAVSGVTLPFSDVPKSASYYNAVAWAYSNKIISGTSATTFSPNTTVSRYQVVTMLYKMAEKPAISGTNPFTDVPENASYYNAVMWAVQNKITKGTSETKFSPMATCERYQMVVFLKKFNDQYHIK